MKKEYFKDFMNDLTKGNDQMIGWCAPTKTISRPDILLQLVNIALEQTLDDLNAVELSERGAVVMSNDHRLLTKLRVELLNIIEEDV